MDLGVCFGKIFLPGNGVELGLDNSLVRFFRQQKVDIASSNARPGLKTLVTFVKLLRRGKGYQCFKADVGKEGNILHDAGHLII